MNEDNHLAALVPPPALDDLHTVHYVHVCECNGGAGDNKKNIWSKFYVNGERTEGQMQGGLSN